AHRAPSSSHSPRPACGAASAWTAPDDRQELLLLGGPLQGRAKPMEERTLKRPPGLAGRQFETAASAHARAARCPSFFRPLGLGKQVVDPQEGELAKV